MLTSNVRQSLGHRGLVVGLVAVGILVLAAGTTIGAAHTPSKGPIPPAAFRPGDSIDAALVPDFVSVVGRDGNVVGYVTKQAALGTAPDPVDASGRPMAATFPVYGNDLATLVGYLVPDKGFVPLGADPNSVPSLPMSQAPAP